MSLGLSSRTGRVLLPNKKEIRKWKQPVAGEGDDRRRLMAVKHSDPKGRSDLSKSQLAHPKLNHTTQWLPNGRKCSAKALHPLEN